MNNYFPIRQNRLFALIHIVIYSVIVWFLIAKLPYFITQVQNEIISNLLLVLSMWGRWIFILLILFALVQLFHQRLPPEVRERLRREREIHKEEVKRKRAERGKLDTEGKMMRRRMEQENTLERRKLERVQRIAGIRSRKEEEQRKKALDEERLKRGVEELKRQEQLKWDRERERDAKLRRKEEERKRKLGYKD